jgi:hypothetical protein
VLSRELGRVLVLRGCERDTAIIAPVSDYEFEIGKALNKVGVIRLQFFADDFEDLLP